MKKATTTIVLIMLCLSGFSQTQKRGVHVIGSVGTNNVSRDQRLLIDFSPEVGYFGKTFGLSIVHHSTVNLYKGSKVSYHNPKAKASSIGLKATVNLFRVDALLFSANVEGDRYIQRIDKKIDGDFEYRVGGTISFPIYKNIDARFNPYVLTYEQNDVWKKKYGGSFGLAVRLGK